MRIPMLSPLAAWSKSLTHSIEVHAAARKTVVMDEAAANAASKMAKIKKKLKSDPDLNDLFIEIRSQIESSLTPK